MLGFPYHMSFRTSHPEGPAEALAFEQTRQGVFMSSSDTGQDVLHVQAFPSGRHPRPTGRVDFTFMYAAHKAFNRDLRRLGAAVVLLAALARLRWSEVTALRRCDIDVTAEVMR